MVRFSKNRRSVFDACVAGKESQGRWGRSADVRIGSTSEQRPSVLVTLEPTVGSDMQCLSAAAGPVAYSLVVDGSNC